MIGDALHGLFSKVGLKQKRQDGGARKTENMKTVGVSHHDSASECNVVG